MQHDAFRKWLIEQGHVEKTIASRISSARRIEQQIGDLDKVFSQRNSKEILGLFAYSADDERAQRPNPSPVEIDGDLRTGLASLQQSLRLYRDFLATQSESPMPDPQEDSFARVRIEAAMDQLDRLRASGYQDDVFPGFGTPKEYWVRSTRPRAKRHFPAKALVGTLLGMAASDLRGGWSQSQSTATKLHNAGYIMVDAYDQPLPLPVDNHHLMRGAQRLQRVACNYYIATARETGAASVRIPVAELQALCGGDLNWFAVCGVLESEAFSLMAGVEPPARSEPEVSSLTEYTFALGGQNIVKENAMTQSQHTATTNLILYGPPGTGKTYNTAWEAVRLCLGDVAAAHLAGQDQRDQLMAAYQELVHEERIEFVTFHQSMSYEEFVEGLRPNTGEETDEVESASSSNGFRLQPVDGVFKRISERARRDVSDRARLIGDQSDAPRCLDREARVFKVSLGARYQGEEQILFALDNGLIHVGWGGDIDWSEKRFDDFNQIKEHWKSQKDQNATGYEGDIVVTYSFRADMKVGDYVVVSDGLDRIRALGRITSDYIYDPHAKYYIHQRRVEWLWRNDAGIERSRFYPNGFRQHAAYKLNQSLVDWDALEEIVFGLLPVEADISARPHVLIIDEINRANISKVFGELITLLELDKRLGQQGEIQLTLPYSKKRFGVPANLHIIGTMNTADRSIALLDTALRRRFTFKELMPDPSVLSSDVEGINLRGLLATLNARIEYLFDREHQIGHAYFTGCTSRAEIEDVMRHKVIPLLSEYFYEDWSKVAAVLGDAGQGATRFLEAIPLTRPPGIAADEFGETRLRWQVKQSFDFSEFSV